MERLEKREWLGLALLFVIIGGLLSYLPFHGQKVFLSPDETGVFAVAQHWAEEGTAAIKEPLAQAIPWLHPRSFISHDLTIVPVGFLGWPWIISWFIAIFGPAAGPVAGMLMILSCMYPVYRLMRPMGKEAAYIGTVIATTSPAFLLYGNRSLFPNAAIIALALWSAWSFKSLVNTGETGASRRSSEADDSLRINERRQKIILTLFGLVSALAVSIRPIEAVWIVPWFFALGWGWLPSKKQWPWILLGIGLVLLPLAWEAQHLYGGFWKTGYWMKGNPMMATTQAMPQNTYTPELFPFGIHPRSIAWNVYTFLGKMLFPWMMPLLMVMFLYGAKIVEEARLTIPKKSGLQNQVKAFIAILTGSGSSSSYNRRYVLAGLWTWMFLVLYYGNGRYVDNINGNPSIGNSFVRYLLPLGFISGLALAWISRMSRFAKYGRVFVFAIVLIMSGTGIWRAYSADEEGVLAGRRELDRYTEIRQAVSAYLKPGDIVISDRSDKIFFPTYRAISPIPPLDEAGLLNEAVKQGVGIGLFARPMAQQQKDQWRKSGLEPVELATYGREKFYRLQPIQP